MFAFCWAPSSRVEAQERGRRAAGAERAEKGAWPLGTSKATAETKNLPTQTVAPFLSLSQASEQQFNGAQFGRSVGRRIDLGRRDEETEGRLLLCM